MLSVEWVPSEDGEHNEHVASVDGHTITVASDRDGARWFCTVDGGEMINLEATDETTARHETILEVRDGVPCSARAGSSYCRCRLTPWHQGWHVCTHGFGWVR